MNRVVLLCVCLLVGCSGRVEVEPGQSDSAAAGSGGAADEPAVPCEVGAELGTVAVAPIPDVRECARMATRKGEPAQWCCLP
jgi:hypothetical protein